MLVNKPIIIVEDDVDYHYLFEHVLNRLGIDEEIMFFCNGKEALDYLRTSEHKPRIIFSDINMPIMNGLEFREALTNEPAALCRSVPFIFLSTTAREKEIAAAYQLSIQGFFEKGNTLDDLEKVFKLVFAYWGISKKPVYC